MTQAWFRVEIVAVGNTRKTVCTLGRWYDIAFLPRVGDEVIFDDSNDDANCAVVVQVAHWMPHKSVDNDDLTEPVSVVHLVRNTFPTENETEDFWEYDRDELIAAGFAVCDWHFGPRT